MNWQLSAVTGISLAAILALLVYIIRIPARIDTERVARIEVLESKLATDFSVITHDASIAPAYWLDHTGQTVFGYSYVVPHVLITNTGAKGVARAISLTVALETSLANNGTMETIPLVATTMDISAFAPYLYPPIGIDPEHSESGSLVFRIEPPLAEKMKARIDSGPITPPSNDVLEFTDRVGGIFKRVRVGDSI